MPTITPLDSIARDFAQSLTQRGVTLTVPSNSDFLPALRALGGVKRQDNGYSQAVVRVSDLGEEPDSLSEALPVDEYSAIMDSLKDSISTLVKDHIRMSKQVVGLVNRGVEMCEKYKDSFMGADPVSKFSLRKDYFHEVFETEAFDNLAVEQVSIPRQPHRNSTSGLRSEDEIITLIRSRQDDEELVNGVLQAVTQYPGSKYTQLTFLEQIYTDMFTTVLPDNRKAVYSPNKLNMLPAGERLVVCLVGYLLSGALYDQVPDDACGTLYDYQQNLNMVSLACVSMMRTALHEKKFQIESGVLVVNYLPESALDDSSQETEYTVVVDDSTYSTFIESGGSPELILGAKVANLSLYRSEEFAENAERCLDSWNGYALAATKSYEWDYVLHLRATYKAVWSTLGSDILPFEEPLRNCGNEGYFTNLEQKAFEYIDHLPSCDLECFPKTMEHLMGIIRFGYTPAIHYLKGAREAAEQAKGDETPRDGREGAMLATIYYLLAYVKTQISREYVHKGQ